MIKEKFTLECGTTKLLARVHTWRVGWLKTTNYQIFICRTCPTYEKIFEVAKVLCGNVKKLNG